MLLVFISACSCSVTSAADYVDNFDGSETSWRFKFKNSQARLMIHDRDVNVNRGNGRASEHFRFAALKSGTDIVFGRRLPAARCMDDLELSLWVRSNRAGFNLQLQVVLPEDINPRDGEPIKTTLEGDTYTNINEWQELRCSTPVKKLRERYQVLRAKYKNSQIQGKYAYVNMVVLKGHLEGGTTEIHIDDLRLNPVVPPQHNNSIETIGHEAEVAAPPVRFQQGHLNINDRPFYPLMMAYHGENLDGVRGAGFNALWVRDYRDKALTQAIRSRDMWVIGTPARLIEDSGQVVTADVGRIDDDPSSSPEVIGWNIGTDIPPGGQTKAFRWVEQIRTSDRQFKRPIMGSVAGNERTFSRHLQMLGSDRLLLNTSFSFRQYRDHLIQKKRVALPGSFMWSWIQTEPEPALAQGRSQAHLAPMVVEPEQIRALTYATWAAGYRGHGYRKTTSLDADYPGSFERRAVLTQLNLEAELIGPILAEGALEGQVAFETEMGPEPKINNRNLMFRDSLPERREAEGYRRYQNQQLERRSQIPGELEATVIRTKKETLVLLVWYGTNSQFVPSKLAANNARVVVPGVSQSAYAVEISTTGVKSLERKTVSGGVEVNVPYFDQTAIVLFTADEQRIRELKTQVAGLASRSARASIDLARAKLVRTQGVDSELQMLGQSQPDSPQLLAKAREKLQAAEQSFQRGDFGGARQACAESMQNLRILQRAHWDEAVERFSSPTASPHTLCFQTLPDHWRMLRVVGTASGGDQNLLRSGDFEDKVTMVESGWHRYQNPIQGITAVADLMPREQKRSSALRLQAFPGTGVDPPAYVPRPPVWVTSPAIPVQSGQIIHISGEVKMQTPVVGSLEGVTVYDNILGEAGAVRLHRRGDWTGFELIREVRANQDLILTFALNGMGEVQFDDVNVKALNLQNPSADSGVIGAGGTRNILTTPLKLLERIPKFRPAFGRGE